MSDAAQPALAKACLAVLNSCEIWGVPVFNGPRCYSIGCNKLLHHHVFARAGLDSPRSVPVRLGGRRRDADEALRKARSAARLLEGRGCNWPFLLKPNSGGFGEGIEVFADLSELERYFGARNANMEVSSPDGDGVALLQEYIRPVDGRIYRVWFLNGDVQCAVWRLIDSDKVIDGRMHQGTQQLRGGCTGNNCSLGSKRKDEREDAGDASRNSQKELVAGYAGQSGARRVKSDVRIPVKQADAGFHRPFSAWEITKDVISDFERVQQIIGKDCHAGSIEFLINDSERNVYFDLNMLSTLPLIESGGVDNADNIWGIGVDPWDELASAILKVTKIG